MIRMQYWEKMNENINNEVKKVNSVMKKNINLPCRLVIGASKTHYETIEIYGRK
jgi:hypothetical protein